jgi:hypothetical protein
VSETGGMLTAPEIADQAAEAIRALGVLAAGGADHASLDDVRDVIEGLERMGGNLAHLYEQLARILVTRREDGQIMNGADRDPDHWVGEAVEALAAAGQASDMMTAALTQASETSAKLKAPR